MTDISLDAAGEFTTPAGFDAVTPTITAPRSAVRPAVSKFVLICSDLLTVWLALVVSIETSGWFNNQSVVNSRWTHLLLATAVAPLWLLLFSNMKLYSFRFMTRLTEEFRRILRACAAGTVLTAFATIVLNIPESRGWILSVATWTVTFVSIERFIARRIFNRIRKAGFMLRPVVVVGGNAEGLEISHMLEADRSLGYEVRGFVDDQAVDDSEPGGWTHRQLGTVTETIDAVRRTGSVGVIVAATAMDLGSSNRLIRELTDQGIHVELTSTLRDIAAHRLTVRPLGRFPVVYVEPVQRRGWRMVAKRALDIALASFVLLITSPVLLAAAIAIKIDSRGPVLFKQVRVGRNGVPFKVLKLRTMVTNAEQLLIDLRERNEADGPLFKMRNDPRVTRVGRLLRKLSIDELPQLWNVIRNDMSMVGPRPALATEVEQWGEALHGRLRVKPGITGMWQVSGRSSSSFEDYERLDLYYVDNWSLATDLTIVAKTIPSVLMSRGAY